MRFLKNAVIIIILCISPAILFAQEEGEKLEKLDLEIVADNLKFQNGVQFIKLNRLDKALQVLQEYLEIFYNGIHRQAAYSHIAEIYFTKMDYPGAIKHFQALHEEFGNSEGGIEAYFRIGICYKKMGYEIKAGEIFKEIIEDHPDSSFAYQSQLQMELLSILGGN
jgi:TolA-binding protein